MAKAISTRRAHAIRDVVFKLNTEDAFRVRFLKDPIGVLEQEGVTLNASARKEVRAFVAAYRRRLTATARIPQATRKILRDRGPEGLHDPASKMMLG